MTATQNPPDNPVTLDHCVLSPDPHLQSGTEPLLNTPDSNGNTTLKQGNPHGVFSLKEGQTVLDLGCGPGFDVFLAGEKVKMSGKVTGIESCPQMLARAQENALRYRRRTGLDNVEFLPGEPENLPVPDMSVDAVLANNIFNHQTDKAIAWREIFRVLKPGGKVMATKIALVRPLPEPLRELTTALIACVANAGELDEIRSKIENAGFTSISLTPRPEHLRHLEDWNDPLFVGLIKALPKDREIVDYVVSLNIEAFK